MKTAPRQRRERILFLIAVIDSRKTGQRRIGQAEDELERLLVEEFGEPRVREEA
jgi:hypothetical protein